MIGIFLFAAALTANGLSAKEPMKPAIYVVVNNYDNMINAASVVAQKYGNEAHELIEPLRRSIKGFDRKEPIIAGVFADTSVIVPFGFVPIADFNDFSLPETGGLTTRYDPADHQLILSFNDQSDALTVVSQGTSSFLVPAGTEEQLPRINTEDFAEEDRKDAVFYGRIYPNRFPEETRQSLLASFFPEQPNVSRIVEPILRQVDSIGFGLRVDPKSSDVVLSYDIQAVPESNLAMVFSGMTDQKSRWNTLLGSPENVFSIRFNAVLPKSMKEQLCGACQRKMQNIFQNDLAQLKENEVLKAHKVLDNLASFCHKTLARGEIDIAITLTPEPLLMAAMTIDGGNDLIAALDGVVTVLGGINRDDEPILDGLLDIRFGARTVYTNERTIRDSGKNYPVSGFILGTSEDSLLLVAGLEMQKVWSKFYELSDQKYSPEPISPTMTRLSFKNLGSLLTFIIPRKDVVSLSAALLMSREKTETAITQTLTSDGDASIGGEVVVSGEFFSLLGKTRKQSEEAYSMARILADAKKGTVTGKELEELAALLPKETYNPTPGFIRTINWPNLLTLVAVVFIVIATIVVIIVRKKKNTSADSSERSDNADRDAGQSTDQ